MPLHPIDVDEEVLAYLRSRIVDFNETPNSVLRRELRLGERASSVRRDTYVRQSAVVAAPLGHSTDLPLGIPEALSQIFEVVLLVRGSGFDRVTATLQVAKRRGIARETVGDKYGRQLGLSTEEFDRLLAAPDLQGLRRLLLEKFPRQRVEIMSILDSLSTPSQGA